MAASMLPRASKLRVGRLSCAPDGTIFAQWREKMVTSSRKHSHDCFTPCAGMFSGMRAKGPKADLALIVADTPAAAAGVFTTNVMAAAPVTYCREVLAASDTARAVRARALGGCYLSRPAGHPELVFRGGLCMEWAATSLAIPPAMPVAPTAAAVMARHD